MADWSFFDVPAQAVTSNLDAMNGRADDMIDMANTVIAALSEITVDPEPPAPNILMPDIEIPPGVDPTEPDDMSKFGTTDDFSFPSFGDLWTSLGFTLADVDIDIPPFAPTVGAITMPAAPAPIDTSGAPTSPTLGTVTVPNDPGVTMPTLSSLTELSIPEFTFPALPTFDETAPTFDAEAPSTILNFSEPVYASEVLDDVKAQIRSMLAGGMGIPVAVQTALFERARSREIVTGLVAKQDAFDAFASRNFTMPPGMLVAQVNAANEKTQLQSNSLERDILIKSTDVEIENMRNAVVQGMAYETMLHNYVNNVAQRSFDAAKTHLDADITLYNASATIFNARMNGYQVTATVFKIRIDAALAELEVFKAEIQAEIAKGQLNEQKVRQYEAQIKGVEAVIDVFKAKMEGARVQSEVVKNQIENYKAQVEAYAKRIEADKTRFDAYESSSRAVQAQAGALDAEARAYAATVSAQESKSNVKIKYIEARIQTIIAAIQKYQAEIAAQRDNIAAQLAGVQARAAAFTADVGRYTAEIDGVTKAKLAELQIQEARLRNNLAHFETLMREYDARLGRVLQQTTLKVEGLRAAGQITSTLGAGAMAAIHVSAGLTGSGSASDSNSYSVTHNFQDS